jgi:HK97 family phage major capsid protein
MALDEVKGLIEAQGKAFAEFKATLDAAVKHDAVTDDKVAKIEAAMDAAIEAKAKIEARLDAERKEREELELRLSRARVTGDDKGADEVKAFNHVLRSLATERGRNHAEMDARGFADYKAAFSKMLREGKENLDPTEVKTMAVGSDPDGGYFVTPDVSGRIIRFVYETSPMRQVASVTSISTDALEGIEDLDEAGAAYAGERNLSGDTTTPQIGKWRIPVFWIDTEPKATQQLLDDASVDIEGWLATKVAEKFARFENREFVRGDSNRIRGIAAYPTLSDTGAGVAWGSFGHVNTGVNGAFPSANPADKLHDVVGLVKQAYLGASRWMTSRAVVTTIRKFKDGTGNYLWQPALAAGVPETIMGYPVVRAEDMPALGTGSLSLAFGDFAAAYQIVDRQGIRVLRDPYTAKPYVKFYTTKRTGGGAVNFDAVKFLRFAA